MFWSTVLEYYIYSTFLKVNHFEYRTCTFLCRQYIFVQWHISSVHTNDTHNCLYQKLSRSDFSVSHHYRISTSYRLVCTSNCFSCTRNCISFYATSLEYALLIIVTYHLLVLSYSKNNKRRQFSFSMTTMAVKWNRI